MTGSPRTRTAVRPATTGDLEFMCQLFVLLALQRNPDGEGIDVPAIVQGTRASTQAQIDGELAHSTTYIIESHGRRVGRLRVERTPGLIYIGGIQIVPEDQSQGVGSAVIGELIREANARGVPVELEVESDNPNAKRLYERLGFHHISDTPDGIRMRYADTN